jgi:hypothetical protein
MEVLHLIPSWFLSFHIAFEIIFLLATAIIASYSFKIYTVSGQKQSRNFAFAFLFLSLSYLALIFINSLFLSAISGNLRSLDLDDIMGLKNMAVFFYLTFSILGFLTFYYTTSKCKSPMTYLLLGLLSLVSIHYSCEKSVLVYLIPVIFLIFISYQYFKEYYNTKNKYTLILGIAASLLLLSNLSLGFTARYFLPNLYVLAHFMELAAYSFIIYTLIKVLNYGKKKK